MPRPIKATISLGALRHNLAIAQRHAPHAQTFAVVKANAYGHGVERAVRAFESADGVALLEIENAARLRDAGFRKRLALLEGVFEAADLNAAAEYSLAIVVHSDHQLQMLDAARPGARFDVLLKINTGMNRLGFPLTAAGAALARLATHPAVAQITLMTHFADADDARGVAWQMAAFRRIAQDARYPLSLANSAALLRFPETQAGWVRPGIMLYGCSPFTDVSAAQLELRPAMTLTSEIIGVQDLAAGERIGYGGTYAAPAAQRVGVVACGYADGYPRHAPTGTPVLVAGKRSSTLGRVSMDMLCVDLSGVPAAGIGTPVTLWGDGLSADEVARAAGTVSYEMLCALAPRVAVRETDTSL